MLLRSYLFVPGNRPERFAKAYASGADAIIVDLEDAVAPGEKKQARETVAAWLSPDHPVYVRVNATDTEWFQDDVSAIRRPGLRGVVLPKADGKEQVELLASLLPGDVQILPMAETALGVWNALELARAPRVERLVFGSIDLQLDTGITGDVDELLYSRSRLVLASRIANLLPPLDGVTTALENDDILEMDVQRGRRLGFGGKLCIHPKQLDKVNAGFLPTAEEAAWAKSIMDAVKVMGEGAIQVNGKMVDRPIIEKARKIMEIMDKVR